MQIHYLPQEPPLVAEGVVAQGQTVQRLARRVLQQDCTQLQVVATVDILVLLGPYESLPWTDGVCYIGRSPQAPHLFLPTTLHCTPHPQLVLQHFQSRTQTGPVLLLPAWSTFMSLVSASPLHPPSLRQWIIS